ncbi:universal bacterial protein YeaZ [Porphyromonas macacae]|uniref:Universal bacterial protein YeaZ n=1 Tax=Porphyromonas macacae TaxID=28115 RepID=A0A379E647_9PORP|nr:tRNA (adenosine(37)-N6)-threonylcarbamoyltransferase complex dimerization subunit type 1 TsaB [Porphyromonas macacae]SUB88145.1 universal bacterial protein YeaZ [Porphyromonas macacae]
MHNQYLLLIETATKACSVAMASADGSLLAHEYVENAEAGHASLIGPMGDRVIKQAGVQPTAVGVSAGPGSYTGLRIGSSYAKGLCFGYGIPLVSVSTLELIACMAKKEADTLAADRICPMIDARRMEVYMALFDRAAGRITGDRPFVVDEQAFADEMAEHKLLFCGNGMEKCRPLLSSLSSNALFASKPIEPDAAYMAPIVLKKLEEGNTEDIAYWQPHYLKEFHAVVGQNKVLNRQS